MKPSEYIDRVLNESFKFTSEQEKALRSAWGTWQGYITDPFRHDHIDTDADYDKNCEESDDALLTDLARGVIKQHPELVDKEEEIKEWIREY